MLQHEAAKDPGALKRVTSELRAFFFFQAFCLTTLSAIDERTSTEHWWSE
jgi:hypothetical protein